MYQAPAEHIVCVPLPLNLKTAERSPLRDDLTTKTDLRSNRLNRSFRTHFYRNMSVAARSVAWCETFVDKIFQIRVDSLLCVVYMVSH